MILNDIIWKEEPLLIGDIVKIKPHGKGGTYTTFSAIAKKLGVENWHKGRTPDEQANYILKNYGTYNNSRKIAWIKHVGTGRGYLIQIDRLKRDTEEFLTVEDMEI